MSNIIFAGVGSNSVNVVIERFPPRPIPLRRYTLEPIPGRSGGLLFDEGGYDNVQQIYEIYVREGGGLNFQESCQKVAEWLLGPIGYQKLSDSYDNNQSYRYAYFAGPTDIANILNRFGRAEIVFDCKPFRYLASGDVSEMIYSPGDTITNPTGFDSEPLLELKGLDHGAPVTIGIGSYTISISELIDGMVIDCELMDCYKGTTNLNNLITLSPTHKFPKLAPGVNNITVDGIDLSHLEITPRWRTL